MNKNLDVWRIRESDFPQNGSLEEQIKACLRYATLAPSTYNTQPWCFSVEGDTVSVFCDRRYGLPVTDPDDRMLSMNCASAVYVLRLALRYFGFEENTQFLPNPADEDLIARVQVKRGQGTALSEEEVSLFKVITARGHNRTAFKKRDVETDKMETLRLAAETEGGWLYVCQGDERDVVAHMIAEGDHIQMSKKHFRRELAVWANERRFETGDGFPAYARSFSEMMKATNPPLFRRFESAPGQVATDNEIANGCPVIAILGSERGGDINRLYAGQAYMRVLLQIEALGLSVSTLSQPCEVPDLRLRLHDEIERFNGRAHYVLRIGYGEKGVKISPRRPLEASIVDDIHGVSVIDDGYKKSGIFSGLFSRLKKG